MSDKTHTRDETVPKIDLSTYLSKKREKQISMTDISLSNLFLLFENGDPFTLISRQILLSESVELISGKDISKEILEYRGFLLNIERAMTYFYLFYKIFDYYDDSNYSRLSLNSFAALQFIFKIAWEFGFPWGVVRPAAMLKPILPDRIPAIKKILENQEKIAYKIAKKIENSNRLKNQLDSIKTLTYDDLRKNGLTGPINRTLGSITLFRSRSSINGRRSAQNFVQFAYTDNNTLWNLLRISHVELILALNRALILLKPYNVKTFNLDEEKLNGEITQSLQTTLGEIYLTINISDNRAKYFNYIPPQLSNKLGIEKIMEKCPSSLYPLIFHFYHPEYSAKMEQLL
jgi:Ni,Fe-hydrogenase III large subunit